MNRIYVPTSGPWDWRRLLADPEGHWQRGFSAMELAVSWEIARGTVRGLPPEVADALDHHDDLAHASLLLAIPEHKVALLGGNRPSQNDLWGLLLSQPGQVSMTVEGKASEVFGPTIGRWFQDPSAGKRLRLNQLCELLMTPFPPPDHHRYQLFHRTASAILEAQRFQAPLAVMIVQSFRYNPNSWADFVAFCALLGADAVQGSIIEVPRKSSVRLFLGWVDSELATDSQIARLL